MRRLVAATVVVAVAVLVSACSSAPAPTTSVATTQSAPSAPAAAAPKVSTTNLLSPSEPGTGVPFPTSGPTIPHEIVVRAEKHQPMLVFFYDPTQPTTKDVRAEIDFAIKNYRGLIDLVAFDVTGALPSAPGVTVPKNSEAEQVALLTQTLNVGFTPYMVFVDKTGNITGRFRGYVDRGLLQREIIRATQ